MLVAQSEFRRSFSRHECDIDIVHILFVRKAIPCASTAVELDTGIVSDNYREYCHDAVDDLQHADLHRA
jgi:hypothetical protein